MTDFWPVEDDPDFFSMRDEDWDAYRRRVMRDEAEDGCAPPVSTGPPKGLHEHGAPTVDRHRGSESLLPALQNLDFTASCEKCGDPAEWYTEIHWPHLCNHPSMDERLLHQVVCADHLKLYEARAAKMVREAQAPWYVKLFRDVHPNCRSCGKAIQTQGDIIRVVRPV